MKKNVWKRVAVCLLVLVMAALLCACGGRKKKDVSGTYRATYNMTETLNKQLADAGMVLESDVNAEFILQLNEDESFTFDVDGEGFSRQLSEVLSKDGPGIIDTMLEKEGITEDMHDTIAAASGYDSYEAFVTDMVQSIADEMGDEFVEDLESQIHYEGTYSVDDITLILNGKVNEEQGMDQGTFNSDGTLSIVSKMDDETILNLRFAKE